jgi:hypothetical protein
LTVISRRLARHVDDEELRCAIAETGTGALEPDQAQAMEELAFELERRDASRGDLEMVARETLEAVALGG